MFVVPTMPHQVSSPTSIHPILLLSYHFISTSTRDYEEANVQWRIKIVAGLLFPSSQLRCGIRDVVEKVNRIYASNVTPLACNSTHLIRLTHQSNFVTEFYNSVPRQIYVCDRFWESAKTRHLKFSN